ncbi:hypothetical protein JAAARDRAFT_42182 [Jaapia argillacea MUCL 33604]|uniref:Uncharacterized protein n=1 Tax=Jaapia argillacea MUCL 33604 TaxID=933084 RepID=A0A067P8X8_9AGAM|nr:hypothetical protein JAAARDRAFT_42182 [Jaapia argillacea MUCL 33604]
MPELDGLSVVSGQTYSDISIDYRHPDEVWDRVIRSPRIYSIVVLSINPTSTLDSLLGEDVSESLNPGSLPCRPYVGFVQQKFGLPLRDDPYTDCRIYFITQGLPSPSTDGLCESSMCVPIWPTTEHPSDFEDAKINGVMFFPEATHHMEFQHEDQVKKSALWKERALAIPQAFVENVDSSQKPDGDDGLPNPTPSPAAAEYGDLEDAPSIHGNREEIGSLLLGIMGAEPSEYVTVDATYDLSTISSLPDPEDFFEEEKAIRNLAREFMERKIALEAEEEAGWAREMKEEQERILAANSQPSADTPPELEQKHSRKRNRFNLLRVLTVTRERLGTVFNKNSPSISASLPHSEVITPKSIRASFLLVDIQMLTARDLVGRASHGRSRFRTTVQQKIRSAFGLTRRKSNVYLL